MKLHLTFLLICTLFSPVPSLMCHDCINNHCKVINCSDNCASVTLLTIKDGKDEKTELKTCAFPEICSSQSVNLGEVIMTRNAMCCNSTLCNKESLPVLPLQQPIGRMCYSCINNDCSHTVDCAGNENQCIKATVNILNKNVTMKGCGNKSACNTMQALSFIFNLLCCEGNLCNTAEIYTLSFFLMIISLSSFIFCY